MKNKCPRFLISNTQTRKSLPEMKIRTSKNIQGNKTMSLIKTDEKWLFPILRNLTAFIKALI